MCFSGLPRLQSGWLPSSSSLPYRTKSEKMLCGISFFFDRFAFQFKTCNLSLESTTGSSALIRSYYINSSKHESSHLATHLPIWIIQKSCHKTFWSFQADFYFKSRPKTKKSRGFPVLWISQELSISDVQFESIKAFSEVATAVVVTIPRGAMGYTLALCLAHLLTKGCHWDFQRLKSYHCNQAIWRVGWVGWDLCFW